MICTFLFAISTSLCYYYSNGHPCSYSSECFSSCCYLFYCKSYSTCSVYSSYEYYSGSYSSYSSTDGNLVSYSNHSSSSRSLGGGGIGGIIATVGIFVICLVVGIVVRIRRRYRMAKHISPVIYNTPKIKNYIHPHNQYNYVPSYQPMPMYNYRNPIYQNNNKYAVPLHIINAQFGNIY